ncbi:hypothetical protein [Winogradskyella flava]|uniref:hypothetical protein n=1 Tax=Winogradskyella flava TaxID=1884876 RepID=UPI002493241A|nr:hypothetical protein [Winogradskyella flava]
MKRLSLVLAICLLWVAVNAQDSLAMKHLEPFTYTFDIKDGKLKGKGKTFLTQEMASAQFTMLGEYHGSSRISEFTNTIIPILDSLNYKTMVLEVGPITGEILNSFESNVEAKLKAIHNKYLTRAADGYVNTAIPFFDNKEDAQFLQTAKDRSWHIFGIDQEFFNSYIMLADHMFNNLPNTLQKKYQSLFEDSKSELTQFYKDDEEDKRDFAVAISNSEKIGEFLDAMRLEVRNVEVLEALKRTTAIYLLYSQRQWYENNFTRIKYMKSQLKKGLDNLDFNLGEDKLLIKMGGYHMSKGFSPLGLYEVGNTLNEIAEFNGNIALNIGFMTRYYLENNALKDNSDSENKYYKNHKALLEMGKENQWVVIDLRPLIKGFHYYPKQFNLNKPLVNLIERYDLLVIPKVEVEGTPNYD